MTLDQVEHEFGPLTLGADTAPEPVERVRTYEHQGVTYIARLIYRDVYGGFWAIVGETLEGKPLVTSVTPGSRYVHLRGARMVLTLDHLVGDSECGPLTDTGTYAVLGH